MHLLQVAFRSGVAFNRSTALMGLIQEHLVTLKGIDCSPVVKLMSINQEVVLSIIAGFYLLSGQNKSRPLFRFTLD